MSTPRIPPLSPGEQDDDQQTLLSEEPPYRLNLMQTLVPTTRGAW